MKKLATFLLLTALFYSHCKKDDKPATDADLTGTHWVLSRVQDINAGTVSYFPGDAIKNITIIFADSMGSLSFEGICNTGSGEYALSDKYSLQVTNLVTTKIACKYVEWEGYVTYNLSNSVSYRIEGNTLTVFSKGDKTLIFTKE